MASFRNFCKEEIALDGDWTVALSEIIFPTKLNNVTDEEFTYFRASEVVASKSNAGNRNTISRPYYGEKVFIKSGEYTFIEQLINEIKTKLKDKIHGAKDSWLKCQGYRFENNPAAIDAADFTSQRELVRESREIWFYGPAGVDFFTCDKHLLSGVTLRLSYRRSHEDFLIISEDAAKHYKLQILEANLYVRKMTVTDHVLSAIESTLLKTPANYPYQEEITKTFLATAGQRSWQQEDSFAREPVRQIIIALNTNNAFLGTNRTNPFHYQKFGLEQVTLRQNGLPIASTPIST